MTGDDSRRRERERAFAADAATTYEGAARALAARLRRIEESGVLDAGEQFLVRADLAAFGRTTARLLAQRRAIDEEAS
jgi:hypothetical protein